MVEINNNIAKPFATIKSSKDSVENPQTKIQDKITPAISEQKSDTVDFKKEFKHTKKSNGIIEKIYDSLKNATNCNNGSKKVNEAIEQYEQGKIEKDVVENKIANYKASQKNAEQTAGDLTAIATGVTIYAKGSAITNTISTILKKINVEKLFDILGSKNSIYFKVFNAIKSKNKINALLLGIGAASAGLTKESFLSMNRIGSKEYKVEDKKSLTKNELKAKKKELRNAKLKEDFKNFYTGMTSGFLAPLSFVAGGIVGIPAYIGANIGLKHLTNKNYSGTDKNGKNKVSFKDTLKNNAVLNTLGLVAVAFPLAKSVRFNKVLEKNLDKTLSKINEKNLIFDKENTTSAFDKLKQIITDSPEIKSILNSKNTTADKIEKLCNENIFYVKMEQIAGNSEIAKALKEDCKPTRTIDEAQKFITKQYGSDKYTVSKLLGVGTIAETYLAKDSSGKEVCIKVLKKGVSEEKIKNDENKFIKLITKNKAEKDLSEKETILINNIKDLAKSVSKETDFSNEMIAAKKLKASTQVADVVEPIENKNGIYIMNKAKGISLNTLVEYCNIKDLINYFNKEDNFLAKKAEENLKNLKAKSPDFQDTDISANELRTLLNNYQDILIEQFSKIDKNGKTIHADIHPGNIFINLDVLKGKAKGKLFTLIDTGNTIDLTKEQAEQSMKMSNYILHANYKDLSNIVANEVVIPDNMTKEQVRELVSSELKDAFFNDKEALSIMNIDSFNKLAKNILDKHHLISNQTQLNINKAKISACNSFKNLIEVFASSKYSNVNMISKFDAVKDFVGILGNSAIKTKIQELKNQTTESLIQKIFKKDNNNYKWNSEELLTYYYKQLSSLIKQGNFQ
ncbi:hypothetical protein KBA27_05585 [bacterium]|nr:hypothetical protein [bacterium]